MLHLRVHDKHALSHTKVLRADDLTHLRVNGDAAVEGSLRHLRNLTNLQELNLINTAVTDAGVARLQLTLPQCRMHR